MRELEYKKLSQFEFNKDAKFARLDAPNQLENINFDDFIMYARSCNTLASILWKSFKYDYNAIIDQIPLSDLKRFTKYRNNTERGENALYRYLCTQYKEDSILIGQKDILFERLIVRSSNGKDIPLHKHI